MPNIDEKITGSKFKQYLSTVYLGQVYQNLEKVRQDPNLPYNCAVIPVLSIKTQIKYHFLYETSNYLYILCLLHHC